MCPSPSCCHTTYYVCPFDVRVADVCVNESIQPLWCRKSVIKVQWPTIQTTLSYPEGGGYEVKSPSYFRKILNYAFVVCIVFFFVSLTVHSGPAMPSESLSIFLSDTLFVRLWFVLPLLNLWYLCKSIGLLVVKNGFVSFIYYRSNLGMA